MCDSILPYVYIMFGVNFIISFFHVIFEQDIYSFLKAFAMPVYNGKFLESYSDLFVIL